MRLVENRSKNIRESFANIIKTKISVDSKWCRSFENWHYKSTKALSHFYFYTNFKLSNDSTHFYHFLAKLKSVYAFGLSVCARFYSHKYSLNALKFIYVIHNWYSMNHIENGAYRTNASIEAHKSILIHYCLWEWKNLKHILTYLYCAKYKKKKTMSFRYTKSCVLRKIL